MESINDGLYIVYFIFKVLYYNQKLLCKIYIFNVDEDIVK